MSQHRILELRVKKHVFNYLAQHFPQPYILKQSDLIGCNLFQLLRKGRVDSRKEVHVAKYPCVFKVAVSMDQAFTRGAREVNPRVEQQFNSLVHGLIEQAMHDFVAMRAKMKVTRITAVEEFMLLHDINPDDISADALIKANQRHILRCRAISPYRKSLRHEAQ